MSKRIGVDVDGVLLNFCWAFKKYMWDVHNKYVTSDPEEFTFGISNIAEYINGFIDSEYSSTIPAMYPNVANDMFEMSKLFDVVIVTQFPKKLKLDRIDNLLKIGITEYSEIIFTENKEEEILSGKHGHFDSFIDDKPETVISLSKAGIKSYYPTYNYTKHIGNVATPYVELGEIIHSL